MLAARTTWRSASPNGGRRQRDRRRRCGVGQLRVVVERQWPHAELRSSAADVDLVAVHGDLDLAGAHRANDVGGQAGGQNDPTVAVAADGHVELDRQIEVGAGDGQLIAGEFEAQPRQHRERPGAAGGGTSCSGERFGQCLAFATELHREAFLTMR